MPFRYHDHVILLKQVHAQCFLAEVTSPAGRPYGPVGFGRSRLQAQKSALAFVRDVLALADGTYWPNV